MWPWKCIFLSCTLLRAWKPTTSVLLTSWSMNTKVHLCVWKVLIRILNYASFHNVVHSITRSIIYITLFFTLQVIQDIRLVIRKYWRRWRGLFISRLSWKTTPFSTHSPITMMEQWMPALSVSTHTHTPCVITAPAGGYYPFHCPDRRGESSAPVSVDLVEL